MYINNGNLDFEYREKAIPVFKDIAYKVVVLDVDNDEDLDLFVAGRLVAGKYPLIPESYILVNDGKGYFKDESEQWLGTDQKLGLINDVIVEDFNEDQKMDLILTGEFMEIKFLSNNGINFIDQSDRFIENNKKGWWFSLEYVDLDGDGDKDLIAGNLGLNSKFTASQENPFEILVSDFDNNGTCDIVITADYNGKKVPLRGKECSTEQMPFLAEKFNNYTDFANADLNEILGADNISKASKFSCETFETTLFINDNGKLIRSELPNVVQSFPIHEILVDDLNDDGLKDIIVAGNLLNIEIETPRIDAGNGLVLLNGGDGSYEAVNNKLSNLNVPGECKSALKLKTVNEEHLYLFSQNNDYLKAYKLKH